VARVSKLSQNLQFPELKQSQFRELSNEYLRALEEFQFNNALTTIWEIEKNTDKYIDEHEPWKLQGKPLEIVLTQAIENIRLIAFLLQPFLPDTAEKILAQFKGPTITSQPPLFPRIL